MSHSPFGHNDLTAGTFTISDAGPGILPSAEATLPSEAGHIHDPVKAEAMAWAAKPLMDQAIELEAFARRPGASMHFELRGKGTATPGYVGYNRAGAAIMALSRRETANYAADTAEKLFDRG